MFQVVIQISNNLQRIKNIDKSILKLVLYIYMSIPNIYKYNNYLFFLFLN
jgi:hypothetical protein